MNIQEIIVICGICSIPIICSFLILLMFNKVLDNGKDGYNEIKNRLINLFGIIVSIAVVSISIFTYYYLRPIQKCNCKTDKELLQEIINKMPQ